VTEPRELLARVLPEGRRLGLRCHAHGVALADLANEPDEAVRVDIVFVEPRLRLRPQDLFLVVVRLCSWMNQV
jgi:hypothetical protein